MDGGEERIDGNSMDGSGDAAWKFCVSRCAWWYGCVKGAWLMLLSTRTRLGSHGTNLVPTAHGGEPHRTATSHTLAALRKDAAQAGHSFQRNQFKTTCLCLPYLSKSANFYALTLYLSAVAVGRKRTKYPTRAFPQLLIYVHLRYLHMLGRLVG